MVEVNGLEPLTLCLKADALPAELNFHINGAADEARTRYLHLGKVALYQMSYGRTFHVSCRGFVPGDVGYYTARRGLCQP